MADLFLDALLLLSNQALCLQRGHATTARRGDSLAIPFVLNITCREDAFYACLGGAGDGDNVAIRVRLELAANEGSRGLVADSVEETCNGKIFLFASDHVLNAEVVQEIAVTLALDGDGVPKDGDFRVVHETFRHNLRRAELASPDENVDVRAVFCEVGGLLGRRVTTADDGKRLVPTTT